MADDDAVAVEDAVAEGSAGGVEVVHSTAGRAVDDLSIKLVVIDERVAIFTLEDPVAGEPAVTIMIVEHPALAQLLKTAFEAVWAAGSPFT
jgi:hypothetical protein